MPANEPRSSEVPGPRPQALSASEDSESDSDIDEAVRLEEDREWEDVEEDREDVTFVSLLDDQTFGSLTGMLEYCKEQYSFNIWDLQKRLQLDDLEKIKLINYVRAEAKKGNTKPELETKAIFDDDKYLQPVLVDDAVLYSLEDVLPSVTANEDYNEVEALRQQLSTLKSQFDNYRNDVQKVLIRQIDENNEPGRRPASETCKKTSHIDEEYFQSYSYNSIHHTMLADRVRTDGYRDFIYQNKDLFVGKTVLDVGCGTGILSMFCAKAGAKQVIAVDNSDIISKARQTIRLNKLDDRILCLRGKMEEVTLPVDKVDIIVSEWMGYCLLYESMLDSVIYARDRYLVEGGLMVPSHATLRIAPLADSQLRIDHLDFWKDVYGFDMTPMLEKAYDEALVRSVEEKELGTGGKSEDACTFKIFDLHTVTVPELSFTDKFDVVWKDGFEKLEGFVVWFDIFFSRDRSVPEGQRLLVLGDKSCPEGFSTGPYTEQTHWQQGVLLIQGPESKGTGEQAEDSLPTHKAGDVIRGTVTYSRPTQASRSVNIAIELYDGEGGGGPGVLTQKWKL
ncbi:hypothetical protein DV737_g3190, partial [Chaetothyriales sp. CBS 132003]